MKDISSPQYQKNSYQGTSEFRPKIRESVSSPNINFKKGRNDQVGSSRNKNHYDHDKPHPSQPNKTRNSLLNKKMTLNGLLAHGKKKKKSGSTSPPTKRNHNSDGFFLSIQRAIHNRVNKTNLGAASSMTRIST